MTKGGKGPRRAATASTAVTTASASAWRPLLSSQRGLSGIALRATHSAIAATPTPANIARQPSVGITHSEITEETASAEFVVAATTTIQRPRLRAGTNSASVE